jgi:predicted metallo-beta-lactamase superfamily hydrolase
MSAFMPLHVPLIRGDMHPLRIVWFDSLGAKSSCIMVELKGCSLLVDPGVAVMHPSFPASLEDKVRWAREGYEAIVRAASEASVVVITHYHYDHYTDFDPAIYGGSCC